MTYPILSTREACLIAFETDCPNPTPADVAAWSAKYPRYAEDFREVAMAMRFLIPLDDVEIGDFSDDDYAPTNGFEKMMTAASNLGLKGPRTRN